MIRSSKAQARRGLAPRSLIAARIAWGAALLAFPDQVLSLTAGTTYPGDHRSPPSDRVPQRTLRLLGCRHLGQAAVEVRVPTQTAHRIGLWVDTLHAGTDIGFAGLDRRWRRAALIDAGVTTAFVALGRTID